MATIRNISFPKAYCVQLQKVINIYETRENYFDEDSDHTGIKYDYTCPDINCKAKMGPVNAYSMKKTKQALHFRKYPNSNHENCSYVNILDNPHLSEFDAEIEIKKKLKFNIPTKFLLSRPIKSKVITPEAGSILTSTDVEPRNVNKNTRNKDSNSETNEHETNQLERIVDVYTSPIYNSDFIRKHDIRLTLPDGISRFFDNCFKHVKWFKRENAPFIFYDLIDEIKTYGKGYKIFLNTRIKDYENNKPIIRKISIYIPQTLIEQYRFRNQFLTNINEIINNNLSSSTRVYFTGTYPNLTLIPGSEHYTYSIELSSLSHLLLTYNS